MDKFHIFGIYPIFLMKYTKFISLMVNTHGVPNLTVEQYRKAMNVIVLESRIDGVVNARKQLKNYGQTLMGLEYEYAKRLSDLTWGLAPEDFWNNLLKHNP